MEEGKDGTLMQQDNIPLRSKKMKEKSSFKNHDSVLYLCSNTRKYMVTHTCAKLKFNVIQAHSQMNKICSQVLVCIYSCLKLVKESITLVTWTFLRHRVLYN